MVWKFQFNGQILKKQISGKLGFYSVVFLLMSVTESQKQESIERPEGRPLYIFFFQLVELNENFTWRNEARELSKWIYSWNLALKQI